MKIQLVRQQLHITKAQKQKLKKAAYQRSKDKRVTESEIIRELIDQHL